MWYAAAKTSDLPKGSAKTVDVAGRKVALFNADGQFCALDDVCPHRGGPLGEGYLEGSSVTCPWHAWEFDVKTGECKTTEGMKQKTYATKVENGELFVEVS